MTNEEFKGLEFLYKTIYDFNYTKSYKYEGCQYSIESVCKDGLVTGYNIVCRLNDMYTTRWFIGYLALESLLKEYGVYADFPKWLKTQANELCKKHFMEQGW